MFRLRWVAICRGTKVHSRRMKSVGLRINSGFCKHDVPNAKTVLLLNVDSHLKWSLMGFTSKKDTGLKGVNK